MLVINVTLLAGTIRATSADDTSLAGRRDEMGDPGDWPPSPARLFSALVAADGTRDRCRVTTGAELLPLEAAPAPIIHASPRDEVLTSPVGDRFVVGNAREKASTVQEYPARKAVAVRSGPRLSPRDRNLAYLWPSLNPTPAELEALRLRAARVGYLGCADSPARITVSTVLDSTAPSTVWEPDPEGDQDIPVPFPGMIDVLDSLFDEWTGGTPVRRSWYRSVHHAYRSPGATIGGFEPEWSTVLWLRFDRAFPGRSALPVAEALKAAVIDRYQRDVVGEGGEVPSLLHGHVRGRGGESYQLIQWLTLPDVGYPHSSGRLHGAALMVPREAGPDLIEGLRHALWRMTREALAVPGHRPVQVSVTGGEQRPWATNPERWRGPARRWVSALPAIHERRRRPGPSLEDVARWCRHAGYPAPQRATLSPVPILPGSPSLRPEDVFRTGRDGRRPYSYLDLVFPEPVPGPVVVGRGRQFGLGLMAPEERR